MNKTSIEWTDFTANPLKFRNAAGEVVWGCVHASPGCQHCYAETLAKRYGRGGPFNVQTMQGLTPFLDEAECHKMRTYKPASGKRCFIGDMTDLFGEWVSDDLLNTLFSNVLEVRADVTWQILTKRADRLQRYLSWRWGGGRIPSRHIWIGVSCEDKARYDARIGHLLRTPARVRFLSLEPLLGAIDLRLGGNSMPDYSAHDPLPYPDWVIVGGESGPGARPCEEKWLREIVRSCRQNNVPCFVKQVGSVPIAEPYRGSFYEWKKNKFGDDWRVKLDDRKGGDPFEWPVGLRVREFPAPRSVSHD